MNTNIFFSIIAFGLFKSEQSTDESLFFSLSNRIFEKRNKKLKSICVGITSNQHGWPRNCVYVCNYFLTVKMRDPKVKIMSTAKRKMQFIDVENKGQKEITPNETTMVNGCVFILTLHQYSFFLSRCFCFSLPFSFISAWKSLAQTKEDEFFSTKIQLLAESNTL